MDKQTDTCSYQTNTDVEKHFRKIEGQRGRQNGNIWSSQHHHKPKYMAQFMAEFIIEYYISSLPDNVHTFNHEQNIHAYIGHILKA